MFRSWALLKRLHYLYFYRVKMGGRPLAVRAFWTMIQVDAPAGIGFNGIS